MKTIRILGLIAIIATLLTTGAARAGTVRGTLEIEDGSPAGVKIYVQQGSRIIQRSVTDKLGRFKLNVAATGRCYFYVVHPGGPYGTPIQVRKGTVLYKLELTRVRSGDLRLVKR